ncbi:uncharacterized protein LOC103367041 [Stegastes partitus]|uniref:Uncharacterized protein LOC103367041 n=1 Tax=Stegastes partitus TaxID=144197 RepID=A0A9Y4KJ29_9TELE|nr:PREDICTED: uncharacterized protein LOC103367041 [Stegastes partitus]
MSFCSAAKSQHVFIWISIFSFVSPVIRPDVELQTTLPLTTNCGENVTLNCDVKSSSPLDMKLLSWVAANKTCKYENPELGCERTTTDSNHRLTLRLANIRPIDAGSYLCKLRSNMGVKAQTTNVTVRECSGRLASSMNQSHAWCSFSGFYPGGSVHWFQEDANLTDSATTEEDKDQHGFYNIQSEIDVQKVNLSRPLNCSLWIPSLGKYASEPQLVHSAGGSVRLQRFCALAGIILVKFVL